MSDEILAGLTGGIFAVAGVFAVVWCLRTKRTQAEVPGMKASPSMEKLNPNDDLASVSADDPQSS